VGGSCDTSDLAGEKSYRASAHDDHDVAELHRAVPYRMGCDSRGFDQCSIRKRDCLVNGYQSPSVGNCVGCESAVISAQLVQADDLLENRSTVR
jgi:hypothetical protein